jgi:hypothetical protein
MYLIKECAELDKKWTAEQSASVAYVTRQARKMTSLVKHVRQHLDPVVSREITAACPAPGCGQSVSLGKTDLVEATAIILYLPRDGQRYAECRVRHERWQGDARS